MRQLTMWPRRPIAAACLALTFAGTTASAQRQPPSPPAHGRDFLFSRPRATLGIRFAWLQPRAGSDLFDFVEEHLTLDRHDFGTPAFIGEVGLALTDRVDVVGGLEWSRSRLSSHYRDFVESDRREIRQTTTFDLADVSASVRVALTPKGDSVSRLAWVPRTFTPYVGGGAGVVYYDFAQMGDFVDFVDLSIFPGAFRSKGWTPSVHLFGGSTIRVWRGLGVAVEGRYVWADADLGPDFSGFDPIDLSGLRLSSGLAVLF